MEKINFDTASKLQLNMARVDTKTEAYKKENIAENNLEANTQDSIQNKDPTQDFSNSTDIKSEEVAKLIDELNAIYDPLNFKASFNYDEGTQSLYVEISRVDTGEIVRSVPSEELLKFMAFMRKTNGVLFDEGA